MPPQAKAKPKAQAKANRTFVRYVSVVAPGPVRARNEQRQAAVRARPGRLRSCPMCSYARYVPLASTCMYACAMPRVHIPPGTWITSKFRTTPEAWHRLSSVSEAQEIACKAAVTDIVRDADSRVNSGALPPKEFWPTVRCALEACMEAQQHPAQQPAPPAPAAAQPAA